MLGVSSVYSVQNIRCISSIQLMHAELYAGDIPSSSISYSLYRAQLASIHVAIATHSNFCQRSEAHSSNQKISPHWWDGQIWAKGINNLLHQAISFLACCSLCKSFQHRLQKRWVPGVLQNPEVCEEHNLQDVCLLRFACMEVIGYESLGMPCFSHNLAFLFLTLHSICFLQISVKLKLSFLPLYAENRDSYTCHRSPQLQLTLFCFLVIFSFASFFLSSFVLGLCPSVADTGTSTSRSWRWRNVRKTWNISLLETVQL